MNRVEFTAHRNNLYDCVINEIEKLNEYHRVLTRFSNEDINMIEEYKNDPDLIGFIHLKSYDIITDKMFRAFVNIEHAVARTYTSIMEKLLSEDNTVVTYKKDIFLEFYSFVNQILDKVSRGKLYKKELNKILYESSFMEYIKEADITMQDVISKYSSTDSDTSSTELFVETADRCYHLINKFFGVMRTQLESKPHYNYSMVNMKHVFYITTMISDVITTVVIE